MAGSVHPIGPAADRILMAGQGDGGGSGEVEVRERLAKLEAVLPFLATKGDVSEAKAAIVMWMSALVIAGTAITITVLIFAINRANPPQPSASQPQPIVIQVPAQPTQPAPPPPATPPAKK